MGRRRGEKRWGGKKKRIGEKKRYRHAWTHHVVDVIVLIPASPRRRQLESESTSRRNKTC